MVGRRQREDGGMGAYIGVVLAEPLACVERGRAGVESARTEKRHDFKVAVGACGRSENTTQGPQAVLPDEAPVPLSCSGLMPLTICVLSTMYPGRDSVNVTSDMRRLFPHLRAHSQSSRL